MNSQSNLESLHGRKCELFEVIINKIDVTNAKIGKFLGQGVYGTVSELLIGDTIYAIKDKLLNKMGMSSDWMEVDVDDIEKAKSVILLADKHPQIFPKIYHSSICQGPVIDYDSMRDDIDKEDMDEEDMDEDMKYSKDGVSIWTVYEKLDITIDDFLSTHTKDLSIVSIIVYRLLSMIRLMKETSIVNKDFSFDNIMLKFEKDDEFTIKIVDIDDTEIIIDESDYDEMLEMLLSSLNLHFKTGEVETILEQSFRLIKEDEEFMFYCIEFMRQKLPDLKRN